MEETENLFIYVSRCVCVYLSNLYIYISFANTNLYYPYNQEFFSHDEASTLDLGEN